MSASGAIRAVTFDYWNTLVVDDSANLRERRMEAWIGILEGVGFAIERERLGQAFASSWERFQEHWKADRQYRATEAAIDIVEELGYDVPDDVHDQLVAAFADPAHVAHLRLTDGVVDAIRSLKQAGLRIGIICDVGMTPSTALRAFLESQGVLELFDHWSFSDEVGAYKPSPVIFRHALAGLGGIEPAHAAHIGDLRRTDVAGAKAMGMRALRYAGVFDDADGDGPEADHVVASHADLARLVV